MKLKIPVILSYVLFLVLLLVFSIYGMLSAKTITESTGIYLKYIVGIVIGSVLLLIVNALILYKKISGYFTPNTIRNTVIISVFLMIVLLPVIGLITGMESKLPTSENRKLAEKPSLQMNNIVTYINGINSYFSDNFGFRKTLMSMNTFVNVKYLKTSPIPKVVIGKDNWLFYKESLDDSMGVLTFSQDQLMDFKKNIENQAKWMKDRGIYYLIVLCPNKETIYPEYLPDNTNVSDVDSKSIKLNQFLSVFGPRSNVNILDLREPLIKAKASGQLYYRTDTHWNNYGAFIGYKEIIKQLSTRFPDIKLPSNTDFNLVPDSYSFSGDLAKMLSLQDILTEKAPKVNIDKSIYLDEDKLQKAVIFRDSFYDALDPYISQNFKEITNISATAEYDVGPLLNNPPEIVIVECVQRGIDISLPWASRLLSKANIR
jgi:hypothetical protein